MAQFIIIGKDGTDAAAPQRRQAARTAHLQYTQDHIAHFKMAAAMLDETGQMNGSVMIGEFPDRAALDAWLAAEPYVTGQVWQTFEVIPCKIGPAFLGKD